MTWHDDWRAALAESDPEPMCVREDYDSDGYYLDPGTTEDRMQAAAGSWYRPRRRSRVADEPEYVQEPDWYAADDAAEREYGGAR